MALPHGKFWLLLLVVPVAIGCGPDSVNEDPGGSGGSAGIGGIGGDGGSGGTATVPDAPTGLTAALGSPTTAVLNWIDNSSDEDGFRIERSCTSPDSGYEARGFADANATESMDSLMEQGATCYFRVLAYNSDGDSEYSNVAGVNIPAAQYDLNVRKSVSGNGIVGQVEPVSDEGIVCGTQCSATFDADTQVTLRAVPAGPDTYFGSWDGCDSVVGDQCIVTMNTNRIVTATFLSPITIVAPPSPDQNGDYTLQWTCSSATCGMPNAYFVVEEDLDDQFANPTPFITSSGPNPSVAGARLFTGKTDGEYCYRVSFLTFQNWSAPHCVTVARTPATLPRTGQLRSYGQRDDGALRMGTVWPNPRFVDNQDGTITDELTGLMWASDGNCIASEYPAFDTFNTPGDGAVTWTQAHGFVAGINSGIYPNCASGYADWRLPNANEMLSLNNSGEDDPAAWLLTQGFTGLDTFWNWTSTSAVDPRQVLTSGVGGTTSSASRGSNYTIAIAVWPVRTASTDRRELWQTNQTSCYDGNGEPIDCAGTGQDGETRSGVEWPFVRFINNHDGTVRDALTGLVWLADADCMNTQYPGLSSVDGEVYWQEALDFVEGINAGTYPDCASGHEDWRLPNIVELRSLLDFETPLTGYAQATGISNLDTVGYWSSTSIYHPTGYIFARIVNPGVNRVDYAIKDSEFQRQHVWPVRGGN